MIRDSIPEPATLRKISVILTEILRYCCGVQKANCLAFALIE